VEGKQGTGVTETAKMRKLRFVGFTFARKGEGGSRTSATERNPYLESKKRAWELGKAKGMILVKKGVQITNNKLPNNRYRAENRVGGKRSAGRWRGYDVGRGKWEKEAEKEPMGPSL